ncbi:hypothetical protein DFP93_10716 [Aneurinibacillus soli]|uniref:Uncharacterized protein n=1 Tax=Aneurinibacillus soli TaxID=1500254 RepID=A0A0U5C895_9BACL|nr:hypothetical protein [Aneurinibacillus soli]PYE61627.1 hypothetical protein DFP93_10716 [Aneurinibacillus soli]BAU28515.1 hypothetical protein CB4_02689 [Aneurinibacillus soli]
MKAKGKKFFLWIVAAIVILLAIQWSMGFLGGHGMHAMHHFHPGYGRGEAHFMYGPQPTMGAFHFIRFAAGLVFWLAVTVILFKWLRKKATARSFKHSTMGEPVFYHTYSSNHAQTDFLDEWEKNQNKPKEEQ